MLPIDGQNACVKRVCDNLGARPSIELEEQCADVKLDRRATALQRDSHLLAALAGCQLFNDGTLGSSQRRPLLFLRPLPEIAFPIYAHQVIKRLRPVDDVGDVADGVSPLARVHDTTRTSWLRAGRRLATPAPNP